MARFFTKRKEQLGQAPGALIFVGDQKLEKSNIEVIEYDAENIEVVKNQPVDALNRFFTSNKISWINISGLHDTDLIHSVGDLCKLHPLLTEDVVNTSQRPKCEEFDEHLFFVLKMLRIDKASEQLRSEQLSLVVGKQYLITFQEDEQDVFKSVRDRLLRPTTKIRHRNSDYLAYALMDAVVDNYIYIIEQFGEKVEALESEVMAATRPEQLDRIYSYKREINYLRKTIRPVRDLVRGYKDAESTLVHDETYSYINDLMDHVEHASEAIETYQVMLTDQLNLYQSAINNRLNDILRTLTIFSVVFIPLTFLAGIYGMNFKHFPELDYPFAYPVFWGVQIFIAVGMLFYFKRKKWY